MPDALGGDARRPKSMTCGRSQPSPTMMCLLKTQGMRPPTSLQVSERLLGKWRDECRSRRPLRRRRFRFCAHACPTPCLASMHRRLPCSRHPWRLACVKQPALRALFCATHSDWERFDEIFDAYWRGGGMRQRQILSGAPGASRAPARRLAQAHVPQEALGLPDRIERRNDEGAEHAADGRGRREGASRAEVLSVTDLRHIADPDDGGDGTRSRRGSPATTGAQFRLAAGKQAPGRRLDDLRRTIHRNVSHGGTLIDLARRALHRSSRCGL